MQKNKNHSTFLYHIQENLPTLSEDHSENATSIGSDMHNFRELLHVVKDIIEDAYSDNSELSKATNQLENVLDSIIEGEEKKRCKMVTRIWKYFFFDDEKQMQ